MDFSEFTRYLIGFGPAAPITVVASTEGAAVAGEDDRMIATSCEPSDLGRDIKFERLSRHVLRRSRVLIMPKAELARAIRAKGEEHCRCCCSDVDVEDCLFED